MDKMSTSFGHTKVYGRKAFAVISSGSLIHNSVFISLERDCRCIAWRNEKVYEFPLYGLDNEVILPRGHSVDRLKKSLRKLTDKLAKKFNKGEAIYPFHNYFAATKDSADNIMKSLKSREKFNEVWYSISNIGIVIEWPAMKLTLEQLTLDDFKNVLEELDNPTDANRETNPFKLEQRRMLAQELLENKMTLGTRVSISNICWLLDSKLDKERMLAVCRSKFNEYEEQVIRWLDTKEADRFISAANALKELDDWIDPVQMIQHSQRYEDCFSIYGGASR